MSQDLPVTTCEAETERDRQVQGLMKDKLLLLSDAKEAKTNTTDPICDKEPYLSKLKYIWGYWWLPRQM